MADFTSWRSYCQFSASVMRQWRYARDETSIAFLEAVTSSCESRTEHISSGTPLWRAQEGCNWRPEFYEGEHITDVPAPLDPERMKPLRDQASEGRANPKGIPFLYTTTHKETAIAEVRPWIGAFVTVAIFTVQRPLRIVNCTFKDSKLPLFYLEEPTPAETEAANWRAIDEAFSRPVTVSDRFADYVPTQILAEEFRRHGFDGLAYHSSLGAGHNIAIFDPNSVEVSNSRVCRVGSLSIVAEDVTGPYQRNLSWSQTKSIQ